MTKVIIDSFDTEEQAVAFIDWFKTRCDAHPIKILTTEGLHEIVWDGVDTHSSNKEQIVFNICVDYVDSDEE